MPSFTKVLRQGTRNRVVIPFSDWCISSAKLIELGLYINHKDGSPIISNVGKQRAVGWLQAAIMKQNLSAQVEVKLPIQKGAISSRDFRMKKIFVWKFQLQSVTLQYDSSVSFD